MGLGMGRTNGAARRSSKPTLVLTGVEGLCFNTCVVVVRFPLRHDGQEEIQLCCEQNLTIALVLFGKPGEI